MRSVFSFRPLLAVTTVFLGSLIGTTAWAQPGASTGSPAGDSSSSSSSSSTPEAKPALSPADQAIKDAFRKTKTASSVDDFSQIIKLCQEGLKLGAGQESAAYARKLLAWSHNRRGEQLAEAGDDKGAMADFETALALDSRLWKAIHNRGVSKAGLGDLKGARADFDLVIRQFPNYANTWFNRGELKYEQGDFAGALQDYEEAIQLQPRDAGFYNSRGHAYYRLGRVREALSDYNRAVQIDPNDAAALVNRGDAYREQGIYGPAAADYREAIRLNPKLGRAYLSTAWLMATCPDARYRDAERAVNSAQKAIELDGDKDYRYLDTLAAAHANGGQFDEAKTTARKALSAAPSKEVARVRQRLELYESGRAFREGAPAEPVRAAVRTQ